MNYFMFIAGFIVGTIFQILIFYVVKFLMGA